MNSNQIGFVQFLIDIRDKGYDMKFVSFHASNLIIQEGMINYDVDLDDGAIRLILDFFLTLDVEPVEQNDFKRLIDDLIDFFGNEDSKREIEICFILYKEHVKNLYQKYAQDKISIDALKSALRRYCNTKEDFDVLFKLAQLR